MVELRGSRLRTKCMLPIYWTFKSTHLYSLAGNFLVWQAFTPPLGGHHQPASILGALFRACRETLPGRSREPHVLSHLAFSKTVPYRGVHESIIRSRVVK